MATRSPQPGGFTAIADRLEQQPEAERDHLADCIREAPARHVPQLCAIRPGSDRRRHVRHGGGGAFGNPEAWILAANERALRLYARMPLPVGIVRYGSAHAALGRLARRE
jgi:hypothetical protein